MYCTLGLVSTGMGGHRWMGKPPRCVTSHMGQLSLLPSVGWQVSTGQSAVKLWSKGSRGSFHLCMHAEWQVQKSFATINMCHTGVSQSKPHITTVLRPFFWDHLGEPLPEENFWTLWCKGRLIEADRRTIWLGSTPSRLTSAYLHHTPIFFYGPDALPAAQPTMSEH